PPMPPGPGHLFATLLPCNSAVGLQGSGSKAFGPICKLFVCVCDVKNTCDLPSKSESASSNHSGNLLHMGSFGCSATYCAAVRRKFSALLLVTSKLLHDGKD